MLPHVIHYPKDTIDDNPLIITKTNDIAKLNDKSWSSIVVHGRLYLGLLYELKVNDYPRIQFIQFCDKSITAISSLIISNLPELKFLIIGDESFKETTSLTLSSILYYKYY